MSGVKSSPAGLGSRVAKRKDTSPMDRDEYLKQREALVAAYTSSLKEYDRLVTWASAGALGISISFLEKFGANADRRTAWILAAGWGLLAVSFALSLWSQYTSSRLHSWRRQELDHCQMPVVDRPHTWAIEAARLDTIGLRYGKTTRWMTFVSGIALVGGIVTIASFAFLNAPFKDAGSGNPENTAVLTEKKGLDYTPPPVPRPSSSTTTTPTPVPTQDTTQKP
jgi:hypothetical protein